MAAKHDKNDDRDLTEAWFKQITTLATSGFGLVAALAWNNVINELVNSYIKPHLSKESGLTSLLIYALIITTLAVTITWQLSRMEAKFRDINRKIKKKVVSVKTKQLPK